MLPSPFEGKCFFLRWEAVDDTYHFPRAFSFGFFCTAYYFTVVFAESLLRIDCISDVGVVFVFGGEGVEEVGAVEVFF